MPGAVTVYPYRTGRTRRLTLTVPFSLGASFVLDGGHLSGVAYSSTGFTIFGMGMQVWAGGKQAPVCSQSTGTTEGHGMIANAPPTFDFITQFVDLEGGYHQPNVGGISVPCAAYKHIGTPTSSVQNATVTGTVTLYGDVEEWAEWSLDTRTPRNTGSNGVRPKTTSDPNPTLQDGIGYSKLTYYEGFRLGGFYGCTISITGGTSYSSGDMAIPAGATGARADIHRPNIVLQGQTDTTSHLTSTVTGTLDACQFNSKNINFSAFGTSTHGAAASIEGTSAGKLTQTVNSGATDGPYVMRANCEPNREYTVDGLVTKGYQANYGSTVTLRQSGAAASTTPTAANGVYSVDVDAHYMDCGWEVCVGGTTATNLTIGGINRIDTQYSVWLQNAFLSGAGEDTRNWRIMIADPLGPFTPFSCIHKAQLTIDAFASATGWAFNTGGGSISAPGGGVLRVSPSSAAGVIKTFGTISSEYRRVRFKAKADAGTTLTLRLYYTASLYWSWAFTVDTSYATFAVDLCAPGNSVALSDLLDSGWREDVGGGFGDFYGLRKIYKVEFANLANGRVYDIKEFEFFRSGAATRTALQPLNESVLQVGGDRYYRAVQGLIDRKQAHDMPFRVRTLDLDAGDTFQSWVQLKNYLSATGAYTVSDIAAPDGSERSQFYYGQAHATFGTREAIWIADTHYPLGVRTSLQDDLIDLTHPPKFLMLADWVQGYAGQGDPASAVYTGRTPLRFTKRLEEMVHGLVIDVASGGGVSDATVLLKLAAATQQTLLTDVDGYYRTTPFKRLAGTWTIGTTTSGDITMTGVAVAGDKIDDSSVRTDAMTDRKYRFAGLAGPTPAPALGNTAIDEDTNGRLYIAYLSDDDVYVRRGSVPEGWHDFPVVANVDPGSLGICWFSVDWLFVVVSDSGAVRLYKSTDSGATWGSVLSIWASGHDTPNICADRQNGILYAIAHDGTGIDGKRSHDGGTTWTDEVTVVAACPAQQAGITVFPVPTNEIVVSYKTAGGAIDIRRSFDNGLTWGA